MKNTKKVNESKKIKRVMESTGLIKKSKIKEEFYDFDAKSDMCIQACDDLKVNIDQLKDTIASLKGIDISTQRGSESDEFHLRAFNDAFNRVQKQWNIITSIRDVI